MTFHIRQFQQPLHRRTVLRGLGAALGLPLLESMLPGSTRMAEAAFQAAARNRMLFVFFPNGVIPSEWKPQGEGGSYELSRTLAPLANVKRKINVISGLMQDNARAKGDGAGDHARSAAAFLTGAHPVKTDGADIRVGVSVDQLAAEKLGQETRLPSLEVGTEKGRNAGQCDSGYSCAYSNNISWKSSTTPTSKEINPKLVFERLFGSGLEAEKERRKRQAYRKSILDVVRSDTEKLQPKLGQTDRRKLDEYFASVREIEQRLERLAQFSDAPLPEIAVPDGIPKDLDEHMQLMFDLLAIAFQTDATRVASYMLANEGSNRSYPMIGVNDGHHHLSHHQNNQDWIRQLQQIDQYFVTQLARFCEKLDSIREGDGTLLDHSLVLFGCAIGDGNAHSHHDLPIVLAGGGCGTVKTGRHIVVPSETPLNNLFLSMLDRVGVKVDSFGDSTGRLSQLDG